MTKRGCFIINGVPRVIINQVIRQSGIYYQQITQRLLKSNKTQINRRVYVDLISKRGTWLRLEIDKKKKIWARMKKTPRIPALLLLQSIGVNKKILMQTFLYSSTSINKKQIVENLIEPSKKNTENLFDIGSKFICRKFLNSKSYDLGKGGRLQLNSKLGLAVSIHQTTLTPYDLLWAIDSLIKLFNNQKNFDDIDHLKNRRIRTSGELIQNQLNLGLVRLEKKIIEKLKKDKGILRLNTLFTSRPINSIFKEFFGSNPLSQFLDQANPLAELTHKRRLTSVGPGGINRETAGMAIRGIHSTHYGRICPIETPEGQNAGLVNSMTVFASLSKEGFIKTPFFNVYKGQVQNKLGAQILTSKVEKNYSIAFANIATSQLDFLPNLPLTVQNQQKFINLYRQNINFIAVSCLQLISIATSLIPFLEHNDANRALMGSNMQRQAVPLLTPERPLIGTSFEDQVLFFCGNFIQSKWSGLTLYSSHKEIKIFNFINTPKKILESPILHFNNYFFVNLKKINWNKFSALKKYLEFLNQLQKDFQTIYIKKYCSPKFDIFQDRSFEKKIHYCFKNYFFLNRFFKICNLKFFNKIFLRKISVFKSFQINKLNFIFLVKNFCNLQNTYLSKNFLTLNGRIQTNIRFNFYLTPTALERTSQNKIILRKISNQYYLNKFNSLSILNILQTKIFLKDYSRSNQGTCLIQRPNFHANEWVERGELLTNNFSSDKGELALGKNIPVAYLSWEGYNFEDALLINERLIYNDVYTSLHIEKYKLEIHETPFGFEQITRQIPDSEYKNLEKLDNKGIIKTGSWVKEGDILVGRITPIRKRNLLPHEKLLYDIVGKETSSIRNTSLRVPRGIEGRVIKIQIFETKNIFQNTLSVKVESVCIYILEYKKIKIGDKIAGRHGNKGIVSKVLSQADMPYYPDGNPVDMILNPLGVPSRMNIGQIFETLLGFVGSKLHQKFKILPFDEIYGYEASRSSTLFKLYQSSKKLKQNWIFSPNHPTKFRLFDGRTGNPFHYPVMGGISYMMKLIHLVDEKIHARSTGSYSLVTQQPLRGRSKHGGQRFGEMEVWALEGFGVAYTLQELLTVKSDDVKGRAQIMETILKNSTLRFGTPESFKVLIRELQALCLDVQIYNRNIKHDKKF